MIRTVRRLGRTAVYALLGVIGALLMMLPGGAQGQGGDPDGCEKGATVVIHADGTIKEPKHFALHLSKGQRPDEDHVRWHNSGTSKVILSFYEGWPFREPTKKLVEIAPGGRTEIYTLSEGAPAKVHYRISRTKSGREPNPNDPSVSSDP